MDKPLVNVAEPDFTQYNRALISDGRIINDLNYINSVSRQEAKLLGSSFEMSPSGGFEFPEGSDLPFEIFDTFIPRDLQGIDELSDYMFYQSKDDS